MSTEQQRTVMVAGQPVVLPDFATEATAEKMLKAMQRMDTTGGKQVELLKAMLKVATDNSNQQADHTREFQRVLQRLGGNNPPPPPRGPDDDNAPPPDSNGALRIFKLRLTQATAVLSGGFITGLGIVATSMLNMGNTIRGLYETGVGFEQFPGQTARTISSINALGISTSEAANLMENMSGTVAVLGKTNFAQLQTAFASASRFGSQFGMTMNEAVKVLQDDMEIRQQLGIMNRLDTMRQAQQSATLFEHQLRSTQLLGVAITDIRNASKDTLENTSTQLRIQAIASRLSDRAARDFVAGIQKSLGDLAAIGMDNSLINRIGQEAFSVVSFASDSGRELFGALQVLDSQANSNITGAIQRINELSRIGDTAGAQRELELLDDKFRAIAASIDSPAEFNQLQALLSSMGSAGEQLARSLIQTQQAAQEATGEFSGLAQGAVAFQQARNQLSTGLSVLLNDVSAVFSEPMRILAEQFSEGGGAFDALRTAIRSVSTSLNSDLSEGISRFADFLSEVDSVTGKTGAQQIVDNVVNTVSAVGSIVKFTAGVLTSAFDTLSTVTDALLFPFRSLLAGVNRMVPQFQELTGLNVSNWFTDTEGMWKDGVAKFIGIMIAGAIAYKAGRGVLGLLRGGSGDDDGGGGGGRGTAGMLSGLGKGLSALGRGLGTGVGKLFENSMRGISRGLTLMSKPRLLLGVATLSGLAGVVYLAAEAFTEFNQVEWSSVGKAITSLSGLAVITGIMGSFAPAIALGAAAVGAIGLALQLFPTGILADLGKAFQGFSTILTAAFSGLTSVADSIGNSIDSIMNSAARGESIKMTAQTNAIERLSLIRSDNIVITSRAIDSLSASLKTFGETVGSDGLFGLRSNGLDISKQQELLNTIAEVTGLDAVKLQANASAINTLAHAYTNLANVDAARLLSVNSAIQSVNREFGRNQGAVERVVTVVTNSMTNNSRSSTPPAPAVMSRATESEQQLETINHNALTEIKKTMEVTNAVLAEIASINSDARRYLASIQDTNRQISQNQ